jgi:hypothetical protein
MIYFRVSRLLTDLMDGGNDHVNPCLLLCSVGGICSPESQKRRDKEEGDVHLHELYDEPQALWPVCTMRSVCREVGESNAVFKRRSASNLAPNDTNGFRRSLALGSHLAFSACDC